MKFNLLIDLYNSFYLYVFATVMEGFSLKAITNCPKRFLRLRMAAEKEE